MDTSFLSLSNIVMLFYQQHIYMEKQLDFIYTGTYNTYFKCGYSLKFNLIYICKPNYKIKQDIIKRWNFTATSLRNTNNKWLRWKLIFLTLNKLNILNGPVYFQSGQNHSSVHGNFHDKYWMNRKQCRPRSDSTKLPADTGLHWSHQKIQSSPPAQ